jgi:predicted alpha/beta-hydrolase family hydrolase
LKSADSSFCISPKFRIHEPGYARFQILLAHSEGKSLGSMVATEIAKRLERLGLALRSKRFAIPKNLIDIQYRRVRQQNLEASVPGHTVVVTFVTSRL